MHGVGDMVGAGIDGTVGDAAVQIGNAVCAAYVTQRVVPALGMPVNATMIVARITSTTAGGERWPLPARSSEAS
jgi:hypothetical protein